MYGPTETKCYHKTWDLACGGRTNVITAVAGIDFSICILKNKRHLVTYLFCFDVLILNICDKVKVWKKNKIVKQTRLESRNLEQNNMQQLHFHCARLACLTNQIQLSMPVRPLVPVQLSWTLHKYVLFYSVSASQPLASSWPASPGSQGQKAYKKEPHLSQQSA